MRDPAKEGAQLDGYLRACRVPRKAVCDEAGMDEAELSRILNGRREPQVLTIVDLGRAIERAVQRVSRQRT